MLPSTPSDKPYHAMGVLPSTQPVATLGSSFILSSFDMACTCCVPYVRREATAFGVGVNIDCDDCNDDGRTSPGSAIAMERGEASTVCMSAWHGEAMAWYGKKKKKIE